MKSPESSPAAQPQQEPAEPFIPTKYRNLSADVVEELWTERFFTDPKKTEEESKNRKAALDFLRTREASEGKREATESTQKEQSWKVVSSEMQLSAEGAAAEKQKAVRTATDKSQEDTVRRSLGMQSTGEQVTSAPPELAETSAEGGKYLNVPEAAKQLGEWVDKELINYFSKPDAPEPKKLGYVPLEPGEQQLLRTIKIEFLKAAQQAKAGEFSVRTFVFHGMSPEAFEGYETLTFKARSRTLHGEMWQSLSEPEKKGFPERQKQAAEVFSRMQKGEEFLDFGLTEAEQELVIKARMFSETGESKLQPKDKVVYENLIQKVAYLLTRNPASSEFFTQRDQLVYENFVQKGAYTLTKTPKLKDESLVPEKLAEKPAAPRQVPKLAPERIQQKEEGVAWQEVIRVSEQEAIGDLNGSYESFVAHLTERGLIESTGGKIEWRGGNKRVVFVGDILGDRSPSGLKTMEALARLNVEAQKQGGSVESLAGNHDNMFTAVLGGFDLQDTIKVEDAGIFQYTGTLESAFYADKKFKEYIRERFNAVYEEQKLDLKKTIATRAANLTRIQGQGSDAKTVKNFQDYLAKAQDDLVKLEDMHANMNLDDEEQFMAMLALLPNSDAEVIGKALVQGREAVLANMKASESGRKRLEAVCTQKIATLVDDTLYTHTNLTGEMVQEILKGKTAEEGIRAVNELYQKGLRYFLLGEGQLTSEEKKKFDVLRTMFIPTTDESRINFTESDALSSDVRQKMEKELKRKGINLAIHGHNEENGKVLGTSELPIVSIDRSAYKSGLNKNPISSLTVERNGSVRGKATLQPVRERKAGEQVEEQSGSENVEERRESGESLVAAIGELKNVDTRSLRMVLREIDFTTLAEALTRQPEEVRDAFFQVLSPRAVGTVVGEMERVSSATDFERAERDVVDIAQKVLAEIAAAPPSAEAESGLESKESGENGVELIEASSLETIQKYDLAQLLVSEQRKAAHLGNADVIESDEHRKQLEREFGEEYKATAELLTKLGLPFEGEPPHEDNGIYRFSFVVARDTENLSKAVEADKTNNDKEFGVLMGYPKTAVVAYQTENAFDLKAELSEEELEKLEKEEVLAFLEFMPSKGNWKEELDEVRETQRLIKEQAPKLYDEVIEWRKKEARESVEHDIPADAGMLVEYAKANFGKFAEADSSSFKEIWTEADADHFRQYMTVSLRTMLKDSSGEEALKDNVKSVCRTTEEKIILQRLMVAGGGSAMSLEEFDKQPLSKVVRESLGVNVEEVDESYFTHFNRRR